MHHPFHVVLILIITVFTLNANVFNNIGLSFGGGQSFEVDYDDHTYNKFSLSLALSVELFDAKYLFLKTFVGYDKKGSNDLCFKYSQISECDLIVNEELVDAKRNSDYLSLKILAEVKFLPQTKLNPYFLIGPE